MADRSMSAAEPGETGSHLQRLAPALARPAVVALAVLAVIMTAVGLHLLLVVRGLVFFQDEWAFVLGRRAISPDTLLTPYNVHWETLPILVYQVAFWLRGLHSYGLLAAAGVGGHLAAAGVLYVLLRPRVHPTLAVVGSLFLLMFFWSDEVLLWPVNLSFTLPVAFGLLACVFWERRGTLARVTGSISMVLALASGGVALAMLAFAAIWMIAARRPVRDLAWPTASGFVFVAWLLAFGEGSRAADTLTGVDPAVLLPFVATGLSTLAAPLFGLDHRFQLPALAMVCVLAGIVVGSRRWVLDPIVVGATSGLFILYLLIGVGRAAAFGATGAAAPRYAYPALALALLAIMPTVDRLRRSTHRGRFWILTGVWVLAIIAGDVDKAMRSEPVWQERAATIRAELAALDATRDAITPSTDRRVIDRSFFFGLTAGDYYAAVDALGKVGGVDGGTLTHATPDERVAVDEMLGRLHGDQLDPRLVGGPPAPVQSRPQPPYEHHHLVLDEWDGACASYVVTGSDPFVVLRGLVPTSRIFVRTDGQRAFQVYGRVLTPVFGTVVRTSYLTPGQWYDIGPFYLGEVLHWTIRVDPPPGSDHFDLCIVE